MASNNILIFAFCATVLMGCNRDKTSYDGFTKAIEFYERTKKMHDGDIEVFFNITASNRGSRKIDTLYYINKIQFWVDQKDCAVFPLSFHDTIAHRFQKTPYYDEEVKKYAHYLGVPDSIAEETLKTKSEKIINLMSELKAAEVHSPPWLGRLIIFTVDSQYQVIYVPDTSMIKHDYWKQLVRSEKKFDQKWFYRKLEHPAGARM